jgi:NAD(P)-dependent dehydrogenase (short-subunit alcohol dehydrogenase family)
MGWKRDDLGSFSGITVVVTGANSGIGWHAAAELARHGASVTLACRDEVKAARAVDRIRALVPGSDIAAARLDLASLDSVRSFSAAWAGPLNVLVNNAGVMAPPVWRSTQDGFELQFGTNHLGHFALTGLLLPHLLTAPDARVVTVSSLAHRSGGADVVAGNPAQDYRPQRAYSNSKLANLLFGLELQRQAGQRGANLTSTVAHPGLAATNLFLTREGMGANPVIRGLGRAFGRVVFQSAAAGADPTLYAVAVAEPGSYSGPTWMGETRGPAGPARISELGSDPELAGRLWQASEGLTGVSYNWT